MQAQAVNPTEGSTQCDNGMVRLPALHMPKSCELEGHGFLTFERWLRSLAADSRLVRLEAKTDNDFLLYKRVLSRWKESGFPHPGYWPETHLPEVPCSYTKSWIEKHEKQGFLSNRKRLSRDDRQFRQWFKFFAGESLMNIAAFVDESGTHHPAGSEPGSQVVVIAGYGGKLESWNRFRKDWKSVLSKHKADYFHYSPLIYAIKLLTQGKTVFQKNNPYAAWSLEKCEQFLADCAEVAASGSKIPFARTFDVKKYAEAKVRGIASHTENPLLPAMEDFYELAIEQITAKWPKLKNPVSFFFDRSDNRVWRDAVHEASHKARGVGRISFENKEVCEYYGLQAADLLCGRLREITLGEHGHKGRIDQFSDLDRRLFSRLGVDSMEKLRSRYTKPNAL